MMNGLSGFAPFCVTTGSIPEMEQTSQSESISKNNLRISFEKAMAAPHKTMAGLCEAVLSDLLACRADLQEEMIHFRHTFSPHIECTQKVGWDALRAKFGNRMLDRFDRTNCSLEDFRQNANRFITDLTNKLGKDLGLSEVEWNDYGTCGYKSDVDLTIKIVGNPLNIKDAILYKTLRDCLHHYVFGGLSGFHLDTECYIPHPAEISLSQYLHSPIAHHCFQTGEKACVFLQRCVSLQQYSEHYETSKQKDLHRITDSDELQATVLLHIQVEKLMNILAAKIEDKLIEQQGLSHDASDKNRGEACQKVRCEDLHVYKEARELVFIPLRIELGNRCLMIQQEIEIEFKKVEALTNRGLPFSQKELNNLQKELDSLYLELQCMLIIITVLQNEGTFSVAEGKATLLEEGGQVHKRVLRERKNSMSEFLQGKPQVLDEFNDSPQYRRNASLPLINTLGSHDGKSDEFARKILTKDVEAMLKPSFQRPTVLTFLMAAYEESMQLQHVILHGLCMDNGHCSTPEIVAIKSGKYALRVCRNLYQALIELKTQLESPRGLQRLLHQAERLEAMSSSLEKCLRGKSINTPAATILLTEAIIARLSGRSNNVDEILIKSRVQKMFSKFDFGGEYFEKVLPKEEHLRILVSILKDTKDMCIDVENPQILAILQAHAGYDCFDARYKNLNAIYQRAIKMTPHELNLTQDAQVRLFLSEILALCADVMNVARDKGFLAISTPSMVSFYDFADIVASMSE